MIEYSTGTTIMVSIAAPTKPNMMVTAMAPKNASVTSGQHAQHGRHDH
jgi:hypothetical protein